MKQPIPTLLILVATLLIVFIIVQVLIIVFNGSKVAVPDIPRDVQVSGSGEPLSYAVMGDSTAISQGSDYKDGFVVASIAHLSTKFKVTSINTAISGATTEEVRNDQLAQVLRFRPDVVLLSAGANDVTHFTRLEVTRESVQYIIDELKKVNSKVQVIVTGSPAVDSVTRFPNGAKQLVGLRTRQVNAVFEKLIVKNNLIHAPIAEKTRDAFIADPTLTASDKFHPNARGYALWIPVINAALDELMHYQGQ